MVHIQQENLALPIDIQGGEWDSFFLRMSGLVCVFFIVVVGLASVAPVYEVALTEGKIVPEGSVVRVEHYEGGIVKKINFKPGEKVEKGNIILSLTPAAAQSDQDQMLARNINLNIIKQRLTALLNDTEPDFGTFKNSHPRLVANHMSQFEEEKNSLKHSIGSLTARVKQRVAEVKATELEVKSQKSQLAIHKELFQMRQSLVKDGYTTRNSFLEAKVKVAQTEARLAQLEGQLISKVNGLSEAELLLSEAISKQRQKWANELAQTSASLAEIEAAVGKIEDRVDRLDVRAPISGVIQNVVPRSVGEVINPGDLVAEMVPEGNNLIAEVKLKPEDSTNISRGQMARVTITAFDSKEFGTIDGEVISVSPSTFKNDKDEEYYEVRVQLEKLKLERKGVVYPILPGMIVRAELIKGERSVLRFLLKPIYTALDNSFGEH